MTAESNFSELQALVTARFEQSMTLPEKFFAAEADRIAQACWKMARCFHQGGRLLAFGNGAQATDAQHVSVEFIHPVIVGKRALPALALTNDSATLSSHASTGEAAFVRQIKVLARAQDIALGFCLDGSEQEVLAGLKTARQLGLLTLCLAGEEAEAVRKLEVDFAFIVPSRDPLAVQETHETLYHIFWEVVHIFFEHEGLLT